MEIDGIDVSFSGQLSINQELSSCLRIKQFNQECKKARSYANRKALDHPAHSRSLMFASAIYELR